MGNKFVQFLMCSCLSLSLFAGELDGEMAGIPDGVPTNVVMKITYDDNGNQISAEVFGSEDIIPGSEGQAEAVIAGLDDEEVIAAMELAGVDTSKDSELLVAENELDSEQSTEAWYYSSYSNSCSGWIFKSCTTTSRFESPSISEYRRDHKSLGRSTSEYSLRTPTRSLYSYRDRNFWKGTYVYKRSESNAYGYNYRYAYRSNRTNTDYFFYSSRSYI